MKLKPKHYLVTLPLPPEGNLHAYVMSRDRRAAEGAGQRMMDEVEKRGGRVALPIFLATDLTGDAVKVVQDVFAAVSPEVARSIETATDNHLSIVGMLAGSPPDKILMELH